MSPGCDLTRQERSHWEVLTTEWNGMKYMFFSHDIVGFVWLWNFSWVQFFVYENIYSLGCTRVNYNTDHHDIHSEQTCGVGKGQVISN